MSSVDVAFARHLPSAGFQESETGPRSKKSTPNREVGVRKAQFAWEMHTCGAGVDVDSTGAAELLLVSHGGEAQLMISFTDGRGHMLSTNALETAATSVIDNSPNLALSQRRVNRFATILQVAACREISA
jgi:hypothetical protein